MSGSDFERWVAYQYRRQGWRVEQTGQSGDHGRDRVLTHPTEGWKQIVQCKRWNQPIGEPVLRELLDRQLLSSAVRHLCDDDRIDPSGGSLESAPSPDPDDRAEKLATMDARRAPSAGRGRRGEDIFGALGMRDRRPVPISSVGHSSTTLRSSNPCRAIRDDPGDFFP